jgi:hypothetical protein
MGHTVHTEYVGKDNETKWTVIESGRAASGRFGSNNVLREQPGPKPHAAQSVSEDKVSSAWRIFIDNSILFHNKRCTEAEAARASEQNSSLVIEELDAFIALVYARGRMAPGQLTTMGCGIKLGTSFFPSYNVSKHIS